jgi:hypothetical protein
VEPKDWTDIENNPTWRDVKRMERRLDAVLRGHLRMAMFCSKPGIGKTEMVERAIRKAGFEVAPQNPISAIALCSAMWQHRTGVFYLDDADILARNEAMLNIAKSAWEKGVVVCPYSRRLQTNEQRRQLGKPHDPTLPPLTFKFSQPLIWNSNRNFASERVRAQMKVKPDFEALMNRGLDPLWINSEPRNVCLYTVWMIVRGQILRNMGLSLTQQQEVLSYFCSHAALVPNPSLRMAVRLAKMIREMPHRNEYRSHWEDLIRADQESGEQCEVSKDEFRRGIPDIRATLSRLPAAPIEPVDPGPILSGKAKWEQDNARLLAKLRERQAKVVAPQTATPAARQDEARPDAVQQTDTREA